MLNKILKIFVSCILISSLLLGCSSKTNTEIDNAPIEQPVKQVSKEEILAEQAQKYFDGLTSDTNNLIDAKKLNDLVNANDTSIYILDIRREEDYKKGHVKGAVNKWWFDIDQIIPQLPKNKTIIVYCYTGQSAGQIIGVLKMMGYDAISLRGGMNNGWALEKLPLVQ